MAMIDPGMGGLQKLTQQISTQGTGAGGAGIGAGGVGSQPANTQDVTRFQEALKLGNENPQTQSINTQSLKASTADTWKSPSGGTGLGDSILRGLEGMSDRRSAMMKEIQDISSGGSSGKLGVQSMMELQFKISQMTLEQELVGKVAGQISQGAQTLFRNQ